MTPGPFPYSASARVAAAAAVILIGSCYGLAAGGSPWNAGTYSTMRLVAGQTVQGALRAGVEIRLNPGWKTYWRYPGDSGVPPRFDFSGSINVREATVLWPAPVRFTDATGASIGYTDRVIFPVHVKPADPHSPVVLRLKLDYAVCEKICVPVDAKAELAISSAPTEHDAAIAASEARVPKRAPLGGQGALAITTVRQRAGDKPHVIVDVTAPAGQHVDLFAEGPTAEWSLPLPARIAHGPDGLSRFAFELDGLPPGAVASGAALTLTAVTGANAIEVVTRLE
jgi:DsbC/DsbD-like thiol-disulfide interchange protein